MFRKINAAFRPNQGRPQQQKRGAAGDDYHSACTVRLVRSTSMLVMGEAQGRRGGGGASHDTLLKRSKSSVTLETSAGMTTPSAATPTALYYYRTREDQIWLYTQNQNCLQYLQELVALRRQYTRSIMNLQTSNPVAATATTNAPAAGRKSSFITSKRKTTSAQPPKTKPAQTSRPEPSAPPIPNEEDSLQFLDSVIASCDQEPSRKANVDDGHADVDFVVATSTSEHDLHSNWVLRVPRRFSVDDSRLRPNEPRPEAGQDKPGAGTAAGKRKGVSGTASGRRLQRHPIHLPKVVESAFQTLRFKPKLKKKE